MKALIQRVRRASVDVEGERIAEIGPGLLVFVGVLRDDDEDEARRLAERTARLRVFADEAGRMNRDLLDVGGEALVVSQFTLAADTRRGRRPSFARAASPERAEALYLEFARGLAGCGVVVRRGRFRAMMDVGLVNDGPVTVMLESPGAEDAI